MIKNKKFLTSILTLLFVLILSALITFRPFDNLPSWSQIFNLFGLSDVDKNVKNYDMSVHYIDVGKADAIFITCNDKNILIDSGNVEPQNPVVEYLKRQQVSKLDLVIASHQDKDHIGGMSNILYEFEIDKFMMPQLPDNLIPSSNCYESMMYVLSEKDIPISFPKCGENFQLGDMQINILGPVKQSNDSTNNNSIVMQIIYKDAKFLFMGDAEEEEEYDILDLGINIESDVIKIGHHGSKTSTTQELLDAVLPKYAVISVGEDNNNLPKKSVLERLADSNVKVYRTDLNGNVIIATNGDKLSVFTQH